MRSAHEDANEEVNEDGTAPRKPRQPSFDLKSNKSVIQTQTIHDKSPNRSGIQCGDLDATEQAHTEHNHYKSFCAEPFVSSRNAPPPPSTRATLEFFPVVTTRQIDGEKQAL